MDRLAARNMAGPLLLLNLIMYFIVLFFASWCLNRYINGQTAHPSKPSSPTISIFSEMLFYPFVGTLNMLTANMILFISHFLLKKFANSFFFFKENLFEEKC